MTHKRTNSVTPLLTEDIDRNQIITQSEDDHNSPLYYTSDEEQEEEEDSEEYGIECIFVCKFDVRVGNMVEYHVETENTMDVKSVLRGVEFKALPSGIHKIYHDYVFFQHSGYYGLACIDHKRTDNESERNSRIRSVGVLCKSYKSLISHFSFLKPYVKSINEELVLSDDHKSYMDRYYKERRNVETIALYRDVPVDEEIATFGSLVSLLYFFEDGTLMSLWKSLLLGKRILFYSDVPIGVVCSRVHACRKLFTMTKIKDMDGEIERQIQQQPRYLYYICLNDLPDLRNESSSFCACTTDRIFEIRRQKSTSSPTKQKHSDTEDVCDIFVSHQTIHFNNSELKNILQITESDRTHINRMKERLLLVDDREGQERELNRYFAELNMHMLSVLKTICSRTPDSTLSIDDLLTIGVGLSLCKEDAYFIEALLREFGGDIEIEYPDSNRSFLCCC